MTSGEARLFFEEVVATHLLHVAPRYATDLIQGARSHLDASVLKYSGKLGGVPLSYSKLELVHSPPSPQPAASVAVVGGSGAQAAAGALDASLTIPSGAILFDNPCIHVAVRVRWCLFAPRVGVRLRGVINVCTREHLGLLVFDYFSAVIYASQMQAVLQWDEESPAEREVEMEEDEEEGQGGYWKHRGTGQNFTIGEEVDFEVVQLLVDGPVLTIVGSLDRMLLGSSEQQRSRISRS